MPVMFALAGIAIAYYYFAREGRRAEESVKRLGLLYKWASNKFYIDEVYLFVTKKVIFNMIGRPAAWIDRQVVNGAVNGTAWLSVKSSEIIKPIQSGRIQAYAMSFMVGVLVLAAILILKFV